MDIMRSLFLFLLFVSPVFAQKTQVLSAPEEVFEHNLVTVNIDSPAKFTGIKVRWTLFDFVDVIEIKEVAPRRGYVFTGPPGIYLIEVSTFDPELGIGSYTSKVTIRPAKPPVIQPPDPVQPPPVGDFAELARLSRALALEMADLPTQAALSKAYLTLASGVSSMTLQNGVALVRSSIDGVLSKRVGPSKDKEWFYGFRQPLDAMLKTANITTPIQYASALTAIGNGLK